MTYSVSKEEMKKIAEELGLEIAFNSPNPGVFNLTTGEHTDFSEYFEEYFDEYSYKEEVEILSDELSYPSALKVQPKKMKASFESFSTFHTGSSDLVKIA